MFDAYFLIHMEIKPGQIYRHYKGNHYRIFAIGKHSETGEELVGYERVEDKKVYFRPVVMFFEKVEKDGNEMVRFTLVSE